MSISNKIEDSSGNTRELSPPPPDPIQHHNGRYFNGIPEEAYKQLVIFKNVCKNVIEGELVAEFNNMLSENNKQ
uniref:Uncharacterized protein n=1 Tax=Rhabditophanes sp. KR3021 TaxID=114890 RepID=A0AC35U7H2_9BILA